MRGTFSFDRKSTSPFHLPSSSTGARGGVSACEGHFIAFGNTEEAQRAANFGVTGCDGSAARDRCSGVGRINARDGAYRDALAKGHGVALLHTETTGAVSVGFVLLLQICARLARRPGATDSTVYGSSRSSPQSFFVHHLAAISSSMLFYNSVAIQTAAAELSRMMTQGFCSGPIDWKRVCSPNSAFPDSPAAG